MFTVVVLFLLSLVAQGQTPSTVTLDNFTSIKASNIVIKLEPSDRNELSGSNLSEVTYRVVNGELRLEGQNGQGSAVTLKFKSSLTYILIEDVGRIEGTQVLSGDRLKISAQDVTKVDLVLDYKDLFVEAADASKVKLAGKTNTLNAAAKDASRMDTKALDAQNAIVIAEDAANVKVKAIASLAINATDVSRVEYSGNPPASVVKTSDVAKAVAAGASGVSVIDGDVITVPNNKDVTVTLEGDDDDEMVVTTQTKDGDTSVVRFRLKNMRITIDDDAYHKKEEYDPFKKRGMKNVWAGFEIGVNGFTQPTMNFSMPTAYKPLEVNYGKSWFFSLNLFETDIHLIRNKLAISTGLGMQWSNYRFNGSTVITPDTDSLQFSALGTSLKNNRLKTYSLSVPILLKWAPGSASDKNDGFHVAAGVILDYMPGVHLKTESTANGYREKAKVFDDFNTNPFRVTGTVRIGYDYLRLFVNYGLTPYFKRDAGPDFRQFQAGITLIPFS